MKRPRTLAGKLVLFQSLLLFVVLAITWVTLDRVLEADSLRSLKASLESQALGLGESLSGTPSQDTVRSIGSDAGVRVTFITSSGEVLADSEADPGAMENHADRPEVAEALLGRTGSDIRRSATTGADYLYVAVPHDGSVIRVAAPLAELQDRRSSIRLALATGMLAAAAAAAASVFIVSRLVLRPMSRMQGSIEQLSEGDLSARVPAEGSEELERLAMTLNRMAERLSEEIGASRAARDTRDLVLSSMDEGVMLVDPAGAVSFSNAAMERHIGSPPTTAAALSPASIRSAVEEARNTRKPIDVEVETGSPPRWLSGSAIPAQGSVLLVVRDVTASRRLEGVRSDFVANASHELKTPAATIRATAETLRVAALDDPAVVPHFAEQLEKEAVRLARIVSDLLDLSRLETGTSAFGTVDLRRVVDETADALAVEAGHRGVELNVDAELVSIPGSEQDLTLMVRNLVSNSVNYTPHGGQVNVTLAAAPDGGGQLVVSDTGIGIPSRDLDRVFERFYRVDRARSRETGGTGLGLSIVKHVAENHGGRVEVTSELGRGSTFTVHLPGTILQR